MSPYLEMQVLLFCIFSSKHFASNVNEFVPREKAARVKLALEKLESAWFQGLPNAQLSWNFPQFGFRRLMKCIDQGIAIAAADSEICNFTQSPRANCQSGDQGSLSKQSRVENVKSSIVEVSDLTIRNQKSHRQRLLRWLLRGACAPWSSGLLGVGAAPAFAGHLFAGKQGAAAGGVCSFALVERAVGTCLACGIFGELGLVHLGGVSLVAQGTRLWVFFVDHGGGGVYLACQQRSAAERDLKHECATLCHGLVS